MDLADQLNALPTAFGDHPLIAAWLSLVFVLMVFLGGLHVCRVLGKCVVVLIQEVKRELARNLAVVRLILWELTTWDGEAGRLSFGPQLLAPLRDSVTLRSPH